MKKIENYVPEIVENKSTVYFKMLVEVKKCHLCKKFMMPKANSQFNGGVFPNYIHINQDAQMKMAGFVYSTRIEVDGECICEECKNAGKVDILCAMCEQRKPSDKQQESFGYPPEYLCKDCYETVPAKKWEDKVDELQQSHRYDFE